MDIKAFCFNPFYENSYILSNEEKEAWIIDPGCSNKSEESELEDYLTENGFNLSRVLLTHAHIDHILGLNFIYKRYGLKAEFHIGELTVMNSATTVAMMYGIPYINAPHIETYIIDNQILKFGNEELICLLTPGHSPASLCYYNIKDRIIIGGDVLFEGSIGRTDLPGGDYNTLISSIRNRLLILPNDVTVYPGHGGLTTIGQEKLSNPFLNGTI